MIDDKRAVIKKIHTTADLFTKALLLLSHVKFATLVTGTASLTSPSNSHILSMPASLAPLLPHCRLPAESLSSDKTHITVITPNLFTFVYRRLLVRSLVMSRSLARFLHRICDFLFNTALLRVLEFGFST